MHAPLDPRVNEISAAVVDVALKIHSMFGPGLLESAYKTCLAHELSLRGFNVRTEVPFPVVYEGLRLPKGYRMDILVENLVVIEIKVVDSLHPVHTAQLLTYLRLADKRLGLLLNFQVVQMKDGIKRVVN